MAFLAAIPAWVGVAATAAGAVAQGVSQSNAQAANAGTMATEGKIAATQGYEAEAQQRRKTGMIIGAEQAAAGQAGAGYGGSVGRSIGQSSRNAELDALNIRYKAQLQKWGYTTQAGNLQSESDTAMNSGLMRAGASLLTGYSRSYLQPEGVGLG
jgi:hypothetical protein